MENGIIVVRKNIPNYFGFSLAKFGEFTYYDKLSNYINDFTITSPLSFKKLDTLFKFYFGFLILLFSIFLIHHQINNFIYLKFLIRKLIISLFKLVRLHY